MFAGVVKSFTADEKDVTTHPWFVFVCLHLTLRTLLRPSSTTWVWPGPGPEDANRLLFTRPRPEGELLSALRLRRSVRGLEEPDVENLVSGHFAGELGALWVPRSPLPGRDTASSTENCFRRKRLFDFSGVGGATSTITQSSSVS